MLLVRHESVASFTAAATPFLEASEAENNLLLGIMAMVRAHPERYPQAYLATLEEGGAVRGAALQTPPYRMVLSDLPPQGIPLLLEDRLSFVAPWPGVLGPVRSAGALAQAWTARSGQAPIEGMLTQNYVLRQLRKPREIPGALRPATQGDLGLMVRWNRTFFEDVGLDAVIPPEEMARHCLEDGSRWIWQHGHARAMVGWGPGTRRGARVSFVYTPPEERRQGYGGAATAALCQVLLDLGHDFCFLFADLANPTSNAIYQRIGFEALNRFQEWHFA